MTSFRVRRPGARIDFEKPLSFSFDGQPYSGFAGDTLASALLANGVRMLARSFKYGRPRGIVGSGPEEPNALMQIEAGAHTIPNLKATQVELYDGLIARRTTGYPTLEFDLKSLGGLFARFMPAGILLQDVSKPEALAEVRAHHPAGCGLRQRASGARSRNLRSQPSPRASSRRRRRRQRIARGARCRPCRIESRAARRAEGMRRLAAVIAV